MKILIVEDNPSNFGLLKKLLARFGSIERAADGVIAHEMFLAAHQSKKPYQAIFLDIIMPNKDGHQVLSDIRAWEKKHLTDQTPVQVIMSTALSDTDSVLKSYSDGCQHYLLKPYHKAEIDELMKRMGFETT